MKNILLVVMGLLTAFSLSAGEWNEKPILCANEIETFQAIQSKQPSSLKSEIMVFS